MGHCRVNGGFFSWEHLTGAYPLVHVAMGNPYLLAIYIVIQKSANLFINGPWQNSYLQWPLRYINVYHLKTCSLITPEMLMEDAEITQLKFDAAFLSSEKTLGAHVVLSVLPQRLQMEPRSAIRDMCIQMLVSKQVNLGTAMFLSWKIPEMICWLR